MFFSDMLLPTVTKWIRAFALMAVFFWVVDGYARLRAQYTFCNCVLAQTQRAVGSTFWNRANFDIRVGIASPLETHCTRQLTLLLFV